MTHRTFISIILAAALAITGMTSTPARAGDDDVAKWIAGAVALGIIGAAISEQRKDRRVERVTRDHDHGRSYNYPRDDRFKKHVYRDDRFNRDSIPGHCRRVVETRRGDVRGFGRRCLMNNYSGFNALPHECAMTVRGYNGKRRVIYDDRCLRQYGYRVASDGR